MAGCSGTLNAYPFQMDLKVASMSHVHALQLESGITDKVEDAGIRDLDQQNDFMRKVIPADIVFANKSSLCEKGHYISKDMLTGEEKALQGLMKAYVEGPPGEDIRKAFLLPSGGSGVEESEGGTTTKTSIKMRKGTVYHLVLRYKTREEIEEELSTGTWNQEVLADADFEDMDDKDPDKILGKDPCHQESINGKYLPIVRHLQN